MEQFLVCHVRRKYWLTSKAQYIPNIVRISSKSMNLCVDVCRVVWNIFYFILLVFSLSCAISCEYRKIWTRFNWCKCMCCMWKAGKNARPCVRCFFSVVFPRREKHLFLLLNFHKWTSNSITLNARHQLTYRTNLSAAPPFGSTRCTKSVQFDSSKIFGVRAFHALHTFRVHEVKWYAVLSSSWFILNGFGNKF